MQTDNRIADAPPGSLHPVVRSLCECVTWARAVDLKYLTNHHPNCPHYNDSLIDVWKMTVNGVSAYMEVIDCCQDEFEDETTITKEKMHPEVFEHLPEFEGF